MTRRQSHSESVELDNRREISGLKDILSQLNANVATNTEATKGLKEVVEYWRTNSYEYQKASDQRTAIAEAKIDKLQIAYTRLEEIPGRVDNLETLADQIEGTINIQKGKTIGMWLVIGAMAPMVVGSVGWVVYAVLHKLFDMG